MVFVLLKDWFESKKTTITSYSHYLYTTKGQLKALFSYFMRKNILLDSKQKLSFDF